MLSLASSSMPRLTGTRLSVNCVIVCSTPSSKTWKSPCVETGDEPAAGVGHRDRDLNDVDAAAKWTGLSPHDGATDDTAGCDCADSVVIHGFYPLTRAPASTPA
jgi:hypothetical protein